MNRTEFAKRIDTIVGHLQAAKDDANHNGLGEAIAMADIGKSSLDILVRETRDAILRGED